jgi:hypothetical protein
MIFIWVKSAIAVLSAHYETLALAFTSIRSIYHEQNRQN